jgi:hypothetical protein
MKPGDVLLTAIGTISSPPLKRLLTKLSDFLRPDEK